MESRIEEAIGSFTDDPISAAESNEHLAIFKRWYYRSNRSGEVFFADEKGMWPLRRIARGVARVSKGEKPPELPTLFANHSSEQPKSG